MQAGRACRRSRPGTRPTPATTRRPASRTSATSPTTTSSSTPPSSSTTPTRAASAPPTATATTSRSYTDYGGVILDTRNDAQHGHPVPGQPARHPVRRGHRRRLAARTPRPTSSGTPPAASPTRAGRSRSASPSRRCATRRRTRRPGASCCTATTRATSATSIFSTRLPRGRQLLHLPLATPCRACRACPRRAASCSRPTPTASQQRAAPERRRAPLRATRRSTATAGLDVKWTPGASTAVDATVNPDFSQIESDVAQIAANERFALFFPEKRPFFLEGVELFSTPIQAVYTRTITSPRWGLRGTGKVGATAYTALVAQDRGGGSVILPGPIGSDFADQDFRSWVGIGARAPRLRQLVRERARHRPRDRRRRLQPRLRPRLPVAATAQDDTVTGQFLFSQSRTPDRPDLADEWDGRRLEDHAALGWWQHSTRHVDWFTQMTGLRRRLPRRQTASCRRSATGSSTARRATPSGPRARCAGCAFFSYIDYQDDRARQPAPAVLRGGDGHGREVELVPPLPLRSTTRSAPASRCSRASSGNAIVQLSPSRVFNQINLEGFASGRRSTSTTSAPGHGANFVLSANVRPTDHLELSYNGSRRWLDVNDPQRGESRLFTARVDRLRATYTFTPRSLRARHRAVRGDHARPFALRRRGGAAREATSAARRSSPTSSTGRPCSSWATATTAR